MVLSPYCVTIPHIPVAFFIPKCFTSSVRLSETRWHKLLWGQLLGVASLERPTQPMETVRLQGLPTWYVLWDRHQAIFVPTE